jgi:cytochrome c biogenesis protein CcmG/thiol:disulfide interchange protein DsbE
VTNESLKTPRQPSGTFARLAYVAPAVVFVGLGMVLALGLRRDPSTVPSPLVGRPVPEFSLPPVKGRSLGLSSADSRGEVSLVNVFASWCASCRLEHPHFLQLKHRGVLPIHGLNYKDDPDDAARWLDEQGDPYTRTGADLDGRTSIDWGVYGVPETFVIDRQGRIAFKQIGPVTPDIWTKRSCHLSDGSRSERRASMVIRGDVATADFFHPNCAGLIDSVSARSKHEKKWAVSCAPPIKTTMSAVNEGCIASMSLEIVSRRQSENDAS